MERLVWSIIMIPLSIFFTCLGVFAWRRKKPMWFYSGSEVKEEEISDIPAYNRANGIMWLAFSGVFWISTVLGIFRQSIAGVFVAVGVLAGIPVLVMVYSRIYKKYKK